MIISPIIAGAWFAAVYIVNGDQVTQVVMADQVGRRIAPRLGRVPWQILATVGRCFTTFFPWSLLLARLILSRKGQLASDRLVHHTVLGFIWIWAACMVSLIGFTTGFDLRYILICESLNRHCVGGRPVPVRRRMVRSYHASSYW